MKIRPSWEEILAFPTTKIVGEVEVDEEDIGDVESKEKQSSHRLSQSMARDRDYPRRRKIAGAISNSGCSLSQQRKRKIAGTINSGDYCLSQ
ncbi:hypothetical protein B296_00026101 [Ensete ventricosum]|uniref:Uncharacterized protein n=1 Tax=Ensete ventricosum TaxID=4639 RepID=A0A426Z7X6_ENSVE|nr:hypothetical protein B296_00026101 [Ensete ventricosum]